MTVAKMVHHKVTFQSIRLLVRDRQQCFCLGRYSYQSIVIKVTDDWYLELINHIFVVKTKILVMECNSLEFTQVQFWSNPDTWVSQFMLLFTLYFNGQQLVTLQPNNRSDRCNKTLTTLYFANNLTANWAKAYSIGRSCFNYNTTHSLIA